MLWLGRVFEEGMLIADNPEIAWQTTSVLSHNTMKH